MVNLPFRGGSTLWLVVSVESFIRFICYDVNYLLHRLNVRFDFTAGLVTNAILVKRLSQSSSIAKKCVLKSVLRFEENLIWPQMPKLDFFCLKLDFSDTLRKFTNKRKINFKKKCS